MAVVAIQIHVKQGDVEGMRLNQRERCARDAEFRFALVRVNESSESIALHGGEKDEQRHIEAALAAILDTMRRNSSSLAHLTSGTGWRAAPGLDHH